MYCSILLHSSIYYNIITVLSATIIQLKSFKIFLKLQVKSLKIKINCTTCFGQYGHHQVLRFVVIGETAALVVAVVIYFPQMRAHVVVTVSSFFSSLSCESFLECNRDTELKQLVLSSL
jgi:hypothetical protein